MTFTMFALLLTFVALAAYLNYHWLKLPLTIGMMMAGLLVALGLGGAGFLHWSPAVAWIHAIHQLNFGQAVLRGFLAFLLFAGALHLDLSILRQYRWSVVLLSTVSTILTTGLAGGLCFALTRLIGTPLPIAYCWLFGAMIAPTDPVAVLGVLRRVLDHPVLETVIAGESLFNDGVGIVLFLTLLPVAMQHHAVQPLAVLQLFAGKVIAGVLFGVALGILGQRMLRGIDGDVEAVLVALALAAGGYAGGEALGVAAPISTAVLGLMMGHGHPAGAVHRMSLKRFWDVVDDLLNVVFFFLMGVEVLVVPDALGFFVLGLWNTGAVLLSRFVSVGLAMRPLNRLYRFPRGTTALITWSGLHGGISLAMALSLPPSPYRGEILVVTYVVVGFSVIVQGLTAGGLARRLFSV